MDYNGTYNYSYYDCDEFIDPNSTLADPLFQAGVYTMYAVIFVVSLIGNGFVCYIILSSPRMRTVTNYFIMNLAVGDMLITVLCVPFTSVALLKQYWPFGSFLCPLVNYSMALSVFVSAYTLVAISIDKFMVIMWPLRPRISKGFATSIIALVWLVAGTTVLPTGTFAKVLQPKGYKDCDRYICREDYSNVGHEYGILYTQILMVMQYVIPSIVLLFTYTSIASVIWCHRIPGEAENSRDKRMARSKRKMIKMMVAVVLVYTICWLPYNVLMIIQERLSDHVLMCLYFPLHGLAMSHACYNPIIYCCMNTRFRDGLFTILRNIPGLKRCFKATSVNFPNNTDGWRENENPVQQTPRASAEHLIIHETLGYAEHRVTVMTVTHVILLLISLLVILKIYLKIKTKWCKNKVSLIGRTVIVTGANQGIGYEAALEFAKRGGRVILACRNEERANEARDRIVRETLNENVTVGVVDMGSLKSVRGFAKGILETEQRLDVLVNNAGLGAAKNQLTKDGYGNLLQVNYLGPFLLTLLLLDLLKKTPGSSRIINVSSVMAKYGIVEPHNLNSYPGANRDYQKTKLLNILFTIRLADLLKPSDVSVFSVHPGAVKTAVFRGIKGWKKKLLDIIMSLYFKSPEEGAQTTIYTALEQGIENLSGEHFTDCTLTPRYRSAEDPQLVKEVFDETLELLNCKEEFKEVLNY